jgi:hypothetical protein
VRSGIAHVTVVPVAWVPGAAFLRSTASNSGVCGVSSRKKGKSQGHTCPNPDELLFDVCVGPQRASTAYDSRRICSTVLQRYVDVLLILPEDLMLFDLRVDFHVSDVFQGASSCCALSGLTHSPDPVGSVCSLTTDDSSRHIQASDIR